MPNPLQHRVFISPPPPLQRTTAYAAAGHGLHVLALKLLSVTAGQHDSGSTWTCSTPAALAGRQATHAGRITRSAFAQQSSAAAARLAAQFARITAATAAACAAVAAAARRDLADPSGATSTRITHCTDGACCSDLGARTLASTSTCAACTFTTASAGTTTTACTCCHAPRGSTHLVHCCTASEGART